MKKNISKRKEPKIIINHLFSKKLSFIKPWQNKNELLKYAEIISERSPRCILEIGTAKGGTLFLTSLLGKNDAIIISIDLPKGEFGGGYPLYKSLLFKAFKQYDQNIQLIRANSHSIKTFNLVKEILEDNKIDFLFIDGDHSYEGVKKDFEMYSKLLDKNSIVGLHDIMPDLRDNPSIFVSQYWNEIKNNYEYDEFISDLNQNTLGIGIIYY